MKISRQFVNACFFLYAATRHLLLVPANEILLQPFIKNQHALFKFLYNLKNKYYSDLPGVSWSENVALHRVLQPKGRRLRVGF